MGAIEEAGNKVWAILNDPEVRSHEDYSMLLIRAGNWIRQQRQLLQDAVDGDDVSSRFCAALGIEATLDKYVLGLRQRPRVWPGRVVQIVEQGVEGDCNGSCARLDY